ncbi:MAG: hypothetical protein IPO16_08890 [Saprospiraceae bacterium]|nr:hypothetical protein [Saprospiraceae bacterium]
MHSRYSIYWISYYQQHKPSKPENLCNVYLTKALFEGDKAEDAGQILTKLIHKSDSYPEAVSLEILAAIDFKNGRFFASIVKIRTAMVLAKANQAETLMTPLEISLSNLQTATMCKLQNSICKK